MSENVLGFPFVGPAGMLLDLIITRALGESHTYRIAWTNLVGCIPLDEESKKAGEPGFEEVMACGTRLQEFVTLARPRLIICVGALARDWMEQGNRYSIKIDKTIPQVDITHPAAILRAPTAHKGLMQQRCEIAIRNAVEEYLES